VIAHNDKPVLYVHSAEEWQEWLERNGDSSPGVRLQLIKKASAKPGIRYSEALDVALCFGWIDGQLNSVDSDFVLQSFTPRRPRSVWSQRNRDHIERLTGEGRMRPAGIAQVEAAKADGRWEAAYRVSTTTVPDDLRAALDASPRASEFFAKLSSQDRFALVFRLSNLKRAETRAARIASYVTMLERGETLH
jgi:uncharacterized protein YdeI (YjbR/CyaY-like superfamily)